jgi:hypothetical protein
MGQKICQIRLSYSSFKGNGAPLDQTGSTQLRARCFLHNPSLHLDLALFIVGTAVSLHLYMVLFVIIYLYRKKKQVISTAYLYLQKFLSGQGAVMSALPVTV